MEALGDKDKQLAELVDSSNAVFAVFAKQEQNVESTLHLLPGALAKTRTGLGKLATAANVLGPTLHELQPFAQRARPRAGSVAASGRTDHADLQERDPAVRAPDPARRQRDRALHPGS